MKYSKLESEDSSAELDVIRPAPKPLTEEEKMHIQRKCRRCGKFYTKATNGECFYHPGKWSEPTVKSGAVVGWSCCRVSSTNDRALFIPAGTFTFLNENALKKHGQGCKRANKHAVDLDYARAIAHFPFKLENVAQTSTPDGSAAPLEVKMEAADTPGGTPGAHDDLYIRHVKDESDTLIGIALRYGMEVAELKRINRLFSDQMFALAKEILIPKDKYSAVAPADSALSKRSLMLNKFRKRTGCDLATAEYYFSSNDDDFEKALAEWNDDLSFEAKHKKPSASSIV